MKVRVKLFGTVRPVEVGESELCTLSELRSKTVDTFQLGEETSIELSLNKQDPLSGEDQTLSQLGVVPGDTLHFLCQQECLGSNTSSNANGALSVASSASSSSSNCSAGDLLAQGGGLAQSVSDYVDGSVDDKTKSKTQQEPSDPCSLMSLDPHHYAGTSNGVQTVASGESCNGISESVEGAAFAEEERIASPSPLEDPEVNRCLQEPLLCRESSSSAVPALLRDWYSWANCVVPAEALWVVVHTLMMEVGFRPLQEASVSFAEGWNRKGFYTLDYRHLCVNTQHRCSLTAVPMGPTLVLHGVADGDPQMKTDNQNIKISDYVYGISHDVCRVFKNIDRLSRFVKDLVCQPLLSHLSEVCGYPVSLGLLSLSYELKLKVLSYLPANSVTMVGQVCQEYNATYKDPCLWRRLYLREFGRSGDNSLNKDWYGLYKEEHQARKERRKANRFRHQVLTGIPPWLNPQGGQFPPPPLMPYPGGIVGGDYDLNPDYASTIPHPLLGRRPPGMNPFLPMAPGGLGGPFPPRPRFSDPFAPGAFPDPFLALGGAPAARNSRPSAFGSLGGNRFL